MRESTIFLMLWLLNPKNNFATPHEIFLFAIFNYSLSENFSYYKSNFIPAGI